MSMRMALPTGRLPDLDWPDTCSGIIVKGHVELHIFVMCRMFALDMLLGNPDRLPCEALAWRGNLANIMFAWGGHHSAHVVAIDSLVQRRPPGAV